MKYSYKFWIGVLLEACRFWLYSITSFQAGIAVLFTGIWAVNIMHWYGVAQPIIDSVFVPCAVFFVWGIWISMIDMNIERDVL